MKRNAILLLGLIAIAIFLFFIAGGPHVIYDIRHPLVRQWVSTDNVGPLLQEIQDNNWTWCSAFTCGNWTEISYRK